MGGAAMESAWFLIRLESDVVVSARCATLGAAESRGHIPGAVIRGAFAAQYPSDPAAAHRRFHSGLLRFGDALPRVGEAIGFPVPLSFHRKKGEHGDEAKNLAIEERQAGEQWQQVRDVYWEPKSGVTVQPRKRYQMKTAITESGQAREGLLFGLESLVRDQEFLFRVDADEGAELKAFREFVGSGRRLHVGRSRMAEFGSIWVSPAEGPTPVPVSSQTAGGMAIFWCLSDLALRDTSTGAVRLVPHREDFGLPEGWGWNAERSFLRTRAWTPFNGTRKRPDLERQVIAAGSVLVFTTEGASVPIAELIDRTQRGVGEYRDEGLGQVAVQPEVLLGPKAPLRTARSTEAPSRPMPEDTLGTWLKRRAKEHRMSERAYGVAREWEGKLRARRADEAISRAQWGELRLLARNGRASGRGTKAFVEGDLKRLTEEGVRKLQWNGRRDGKRHGEYLAGLVTGENDSDVALRALEIVAASIVRPASGNGREVRNGR